jgi:hypothetical protein
MKPKRMRWIRHRVKTNTYRPSLGNLKKTDQQGDIRIGERIILKWYLKQTEKRGMDLSF